MAEICAPLFLVLFKPKTERFQVIVAEYRAHQLREVSEAVFPVDASYPMPSVNHVSLMAAVLNLPVVAIEIGDKFDHVGWQLREGFVL
jgi:hypothetical protein